MPKFNTDDKQFIPGAIGNPVLADEPLDPDLGRPPTVQEYQAWQRRQAANNCGRRHIPQDAVRRAGSFG